MRGPRFARLIVLAPLAFAASVAEDVRGIRGAPGITETAPAPPLAPPAESEKRGARSYPEQPPTIPHSIAGYEISLRANKCLACHSRRRSAETGAPMAGVTHFMGRDLQVLSEISPRRYFCTQCHVPQAAAAPPIGNGFIDGADLPE